MSAVRNPEITVVRAGPDDSADIWRWRNDEQTRAMSLAIDPIGWDEHSQWFIRVLGDPLRVIYVGNRGNEKVGMVRFDSRDAGIAEVSINLNPKMRGKGLCCPLLTTAIAEFRRTQPVCLLAVVKKTNAASVACFMKAGFVIGVSSDATNYNLVENGDRQ